MKKLLKKIIPPFFLDCVAAIGMDNAEGKRIWVASAFFYGHYVGVDTVDKSKNRYSVYLVTNRHVFEGLSKAYVRCNPQKSDVFVCKNY